MGSMSEGGSNGGLGRCVGEGGGGTGEQVEQQLVEILFKPEKVQVGIGSHK